MAKRVKKTTSTKQTAATRRTKKTATATKKAPVKNKDIDTTPKPKKDTTPKPKKGEAVTSGKETEPKKGAKVPKKPLSKKSTVTSGKKKDKVVKKKGPVKKGKVPVKKMVKTTFAAVAKVKSDAEAAIKPYTKGKRKGKKYHIIPSNAPREEFVLMGDKVKKGEVKWAYYAIDGNMGYHHYEKLK